MSQEVLVWVERSCPEFEMNQRRNAVHFGRLPQPKHGRVSDVVFAIGLVAQLGLSLAVAYRLLLGVVMTTEVVILSSQTERTRSVFSVIKK